MPTPSSPPPSSSSPEARPVDGEAVLAGLSPAHLVAGRPSLAGPTGLRAVDPASGQPVGPAFPTATDAEVAAACAAAAAAIDPVAPPEPAQLAALLEAAAAELEARGEQLVAVAEVETRLGLPRLTGELGRTCGQLRLFAAVVRDGAHLDVRIDHADDRLVPPRPDLRRWRVARGPVAVFGASNFPLAFSVAGGDTASALAAGCPVVVKAHPSHPGTSQLAGEALTAAVATVGLPPGWFSLLHGADQAVGRALVLAPEITAVGFTGSLAGGRALHALGAGRAVPIPVYAEMGSLNPVFVSAGAAAARAGEVAAGFVASLTLGTGQFCTKPGLVFVPDSHDGMRVTAAIAEAVEAQPAGTLLNRGVLDGLQARLATSRGTAGVEVLATGPAPAPDGFGCATTVLRTDLATFQAVEALTEEHFGPVAVVVRCPGTAGLEAAADGLAGSLTATLHAEPEEAAELAGLQGRLQARCGRLIWNQFPTGVAVTAAMHHGGPYPATTDAAHTSVGIAAIDRFLRPVCYQNTPEPALPPALREGNPWGLPRLVDGHRQEP